MKIFAKILKQKSTAKDAKAEFFVEKADDLVKLSPDFKNVEELSELKSIIETFGDFTDSQLQKFALEKSLLCVGVRVHQKHNLLNTKIRIYLSD